jgi:hypothetical protein
MTLTTEFDSEAFVDALLYPDLPPPDGLTAWHGGRPLRRFSVYRNNVIGGLINALHARFPVCLRLVGEDFFDQMAWHYVRASLPQSPIMSDYGGDLADFIPTFEPAQELPYLADVARLEYAMGRAYHAADAAPLTRDFMRSLPGDLLEGAAASLHPSVQIVPSKYPIVSIWRENASLEEPTELELGGAEDALVVRPRLEVTAHVLPVGGYAFAKVLGDGGKFREAIDAAMRVAVDFDLTECLRVLLASDAFIAIRVEA